MPTRDEEQEIRKAMDDAATGAAGAAEPDRDLVSELSDLYEQSNRVQTRAAGLLKEATAYNDQLREMVESYRAADEAMRKVSDASG